MRGAGKEGTHGLLASATSEDVEQMKYVPKAPTEDDALGR